jgi:hypothetical protein
VEGKELLSSCQWRLTDPEAWSRCFPGKNEVATKCPTRLTYMIEGRSTNRVDVSEKRRRKEEQLCRSAWL